MTVVVFDWEAWQQAYPSFIALSEEQSNVAFATAEQFCNNTDVSPVKDVKLRTTLLWLLTAHVARLLYGENGEPPSDLVGRIQSASEGSVSVGVGPYGEGMATPGMEWYTQTKYGAMYWQMTAFYRSARYYPGPQRFFQGYPVPYGRGGGWWPV